MIDAPALTISIAKFIRHEVEKESVKEVNMEKQFSMLAEEVNDRIKRKRPGPDKEDGLDSAIMLPDRYI